MAHGYRTLQRWNQWLGQQFLGNNLLNAEQQCLAQLLNKHFGKHAVLIGVPEQHLLLNATTIPCHSLVTPIIYAEKHVSLIDGDFHELPFITGSIDLVMLPHTLELVDHPRQLLAEACRVIKPEGLIVISGFNPYSILGFQRLIAKYKIAPWGGNLIRPQQVKSWLQLADFQLEQQKTLLFRPWVSRSFYQKLVFLEFLGQRIFPFFGGVYVLLARAKVIPLTPIRLKWKQQLSDIRISTTISGHIARTSK